MKRLTFFRGILAGLVLVLSAAGRPGAPDAALAANAASPGDTPWTIITVDSTGDVGQYASLGLRPSDDTPFVVYYDATQTDLREAYPSANGGNCGPANTWDCDTEPGFSDSQGQYASLDFGPYTAFASAYYDATGSRNRYNGYLDPNAVNPAWGVVVDDLPNFSGQPDTETGRYNSLKIAYDGVIHIASQQSYPAPTGLRYATYVGTGGTGCGYMTTWDCVTVDEGSDNTGAYASLDLDYLARPRIAYRGPGGVLKLARWLGSGGNCGNGEWQCDVIDAGAGAGNFISLYVPKCAPLQCNGRTSWIAYYDAPNDRLKVAQLVGGNSGNCGFGGQTDDWQCSVIETVGSAAAMGVSLTLVDGEPLIAYHDADDQGNGILKIAYPEALGNCGPLSGGQLQLHTWQCLTVDDGVRPGGINHNVGRYASLGVGSDGLATIAYYDSSAGDLLVAYQEAAQAAPYQIFVPVVVN